MKYSANVIHEDGICTITAPTLEAMYHMIFDINADIYVGSTQVKAKNDRKAGVSGYWLGYTRGGLAKVYEEAGA